MFSKIFNLHLISKISSKKPPLHLANLTTTTIYDNIPFKVLSLSNLRNFSKYQKNHVESSDSDDDYQISINDIVIPREKVETRFARSSGPGGQNVNKTNSKAEIRFNLNTCDWLEQKVKDKLRKIHKNSINKDGDCIVTCQTGRSQATNLEDAFEKLRYMILEASLVEKERKFKIPAETENLEKNRIHSKRRKGDVKRLRNSKFDDQSTR